MKVLIDDQGLGRLLRGMRLPEVPAGSEVFTTGYWYVRLCQAVLADPGATGKLSRPFAELPESLRWRAMGAVVKLPDSIGLLSLRTLGPRIGQLRRHYPLNILSIEALAAAAKLDAHVLLSCSSPRLTDALEREGCTWSLLGG